MEMVSFLKKNLPKYSSIDKPQSYPTKAAMFSGFFVFDEL